MLSVASTLAPLIMPPNAAPTTVAELSIADVLPAMKRIVIPEMVPNSAPTLAKYNGDKLVPKLSDFRARIKPCMEPRRK